MRSETEFRLISPNEIERISERGPATREAKGSVGFGGQLSSAMQTLDNLHVEADQQAEAIASGGGNLHEVALAFEKADVAMRLATKVRNKIVDAYNEIMKMSV
ncbi:MAG TPA: flagellar hook-basal body complex protein FliE [Polyangia bacterium]